MTETPSSGKYSFFGRDFVCDSKFIQFFSSQLTDLWSKTLRSIVGLGVHYICTKKKKKILSTESDSPIDTKVIPSFSVVSSWKLGLLDVLF